MKLENGVLHITFEPVTAQIMDELRPRAIAFPGTGTDHIDLEAAKERGIKVISLRGETKFLKSIPSTAELTMWFMLELLRRPHKGRYLGCQLKDKKLGIIGMGRIGYMVQNYARAFGMLVCGVDKDTSENLREDLLKNSHIISLHVLLTPESKEMITKKHLEMMRGTVLVNTARGGLIEKGAVIEAIKAGWISGYGTDVPTDKEEEKELWKLRDNGYNVVITEHIGGNTIEARAATDKFIEDKVKKFLNNTKVKT